MQYENLGLESEVSVERGSVGEALGNNMGCSIYAVDSCLLVILVL
jgi:hypothetical protein